MNIEYEDIFQDKFIFESVGRSYYTDVYPQLVKTRDRKKTKCIKELLNLIMTLKCCSCIGENNVVLLEPMFERLFSRTNSNINLYLLHDSGKDYKKYRNTRYRQYFYRRWQRAIDKSFFSHNMSYANKASEELIRFYKRNRIKAVVMGNDKRFIERLLLISAQAVGIPVIVIQHGVYSDKWSFGRLKTADTADYFWAWSNYIKDCYIKRFAKDPSRVKVIGYPFEYIAINSTKRNAVLFIGNQYRNDDCEKTTHLGIAKTVLKICKRKGLDFIYRPHPGEKTDEEYGELSDYISQGRTLLEDFSLSKIAVGDISTAMVEAALSGLHVIQILWNETSRQAIDDHIYDFTVKVNNRSDEIEAAIDSCMRSEDKVGLDNDYLYINPNICFDVSDYLNETIGVK